MSFSGRAVVVGGHGAIGKKLVAALALQLADPDRVVAIGRSGTENGVRLPDDVSVVYHVAGERNMEQAQQRRVQLDLVRELYDLAEQRAIPRLVYLSSIKAIAPDGCLNEVDGGLPLSQLSTYGRAKREAESWLLERASGGATEVVVLRSPMVYGAHAEGGMERLCRWLLRGWPVPVSEAAYRDAVFVDNLIFALLELGAQPQQRPLLHVCDGAPLSTAAWARTLGEMLDLKPKLIRVPPAIAPVLCRVPGTSAALSRLLLPLRFARENLMFACRDGLPYDLPQGLAASLEQLTPH